MGPITAILPTDKERQSVSLTEAWVAMHLTEIDKPINIPQIKDKTKGWLVTVPESAVLDSKDVVYQLRPGYGWFGDDARARKQLDEWQKHDGTIVYLVIRDSTQKENGGWLAQPVREGLLTMDMTQLNDEYAAFKVAKRPEELMYRAAIIARGEQLPE